MTTHPENRPLRINMDNWLYALNLISLWNRDYMYLNLFFIWLQD